MKVASHTDPELFYETADTMCVWCGEELLDDDIILDDTGEPHCSDACVKHTAEARLNAATLPYETLAEVL